MFPPGGFFRCSEGRRLAGDGTQDKQVPPSVQFVVGCVVAAAFAFFFHTSCYNSVKTFFNRATHFFSHWGEECLHCSGDRKRPSRKGCRKVAKD